MHDFDKEQEIQGLFVLIRELQANLSHPIMVAIDGGSGSGKSTMAAFIADQLDAAVIPLDDFFSAHIPEDQWDRFTVEERLKHVFDWGRLRCQALLPLLQGEAARWQAFDFTTGPRPDGTYLMEREYKRREPANVILVEGAYSASPALADLLDLAVLVDVPLEIRHARLVDREEPLFLACWHQRWDAVEALYFNHVRPRNSYDVVIHAE